MDANRRFYRLIRFYAAAWVLSCGGVLALLQRPADGDAPCHSGAVPVPAGAHPPPVVFPGQRGTVHPTGRVCAAGLLRRISAVPSAHPVPAGISPLRRPPRCRACTISLRFCSFLPSGCWSVRRQKRNISLDVPQKLHHSSLTIGLVICPGKNAPGALARKPRRRHGTAPAAIFANPGPSGPVGI